MPVLVDITDSVVQHLGIDSTPRTGEPAGIAGVAAVGSVSVSASVVAVAVPGSAAAGSASLSASMAVPGVASGFALGLPQVNVKAPVYGVGSGADVGLPVAFTSMNIAGFSAAGGGPGSPSLAMVMNPDGVASGAVFGDADTLVTVFIVPGPVDPSNDFGDAVVTKYGWVFRGPRNVYQWRMPPLKEYEGISLVKESGVWTEVAHPDLERTLSAQKYLPGGHDHVVSTSLKDELIGAGYTVTSEVVTTEDYET